MKQVDASFLSDVNRKSKGVVRSQFFNLLGALIIVALFIARFSTVAESGLTVSQFAGKLGLIFFFISSMYVNYYNFGKQRGKNDESFLSVKSAFSETAAELIDKKLVHGLQKFCVDFLRDELENRRKRLLFNVNVDHDEYLMKYANRSALSIIFDRSMKARVKRAVIRANRLRPSRLTPEMLLNEKGASHKFSLGKTEAQKTGFDISSKLIRSVMVAWFFGFYSLKLMSGFNVAVLGEFIAQAVSLVLAAISGFSSGYDSIIGNLKSRYQLRHDMLKVYLETTEKADKSK